MCSLQTGAERMPEVFFFFQAEDGIRDYKVTGVQTCALPISAGWPSWVLPAASREIVTDCLAVTGRPGPGDRPDRRRTAPARQGRPAGQGAPEDRKSVV